MKFRVDRDQFADATVWAGRSVPLKSPSPLLSGLRLEARDDGEPRISVAMHDYEISNRAELVADVAEPGVTVVNGRLIADIAKSLPNQPVEVIAEGSRLRLQCGRSRFELPTLPVDDYPPLPDMPEPTGSVPGPVFASAVTQVAVAAGRDDSPQHLSGIQIEVDDDEVTLAATDRYRLAVREFTWAPRVVGREMTALIPARTLLDAAKSLGHADQVHLAMGTATEGTGILGIEGMNRRTTTRQITGDFPDYRRLLPKAHTTVARVETQALIEAVKRVSLVERSSAVRLLFTGQEVTLDAGSGEESTGTDVIECETSGERMERIAFNPAYLLDGLIALGRPVACMAFTVPSKPAVLTGAVDLTSEASDDYLYLLMPVRLPA